jgi:hypothetical protein
VEWYWQEKIEEPEKKQFWCHFVDHKFDMDWPGRETCPLGSPATYCLSHSTALRVKQLGKRSFGRHVMVE